MLPTVNWSTGEIAGPEIGESAKTLGELAGVFKDERAWAASDAGAVVYRVQFWRPVADATEGGLFWGNSTVFPGKVGDEYYMTKGHFHAIGNRGEYYATVRGEGMLLLMDRDRKTTAQPMRPGSLHYIPGETAHRVVNVGSEPLTFLACWPSDAGYDYGTIQKEGFSARVIEQGGKPVVVASKP